MNKELSSKELGLLACTSLVIGNMIGSGVFLLPASLGSLGPIALLGWVVTSLGALVLALIFSRLSKVTTKTGGPYAYTQMAYGDFAGFLIAWGYWIALWTGNAAVAVAIVGYSSFFFPLLSQSVLLGFIVALGAIWLVTLINMYGLKEAGFFQTLTMVLKLIPLLVIGIIGLFWVDSANYVPFNQSGKTAISAISAAAALTLWAYLGLESATVPAGNVREPEKTIPRATLIGILVTAGVYISVTAVSMGVMPSSELAKSTAPLSDVGRIMFGSIGASLITLGAVISSLGTLNGFTLMTGQVPCAAALDHLFPDIMGVKSPQGTPVKALLISGILTTILMAMNFTKGLVGAFEFVILLAVMATLLPYVFCAFSEIMIRLRGGTKLHGRELIKVVILASLGFVYSIWALIGAGADVVVTGMVLILAGIPVYVWIRWKHPETIQENLS